MEPLQLFTLLGFGFAIGLKHAFEADHVAAVSAIVSQTKSFKRSSFLGAAWGLGHTTTLLLVGVLVLVFRVSIPEKVALSLEFLVGIVLVVLGAGVLLSVFRSKTHIHVHTHDSTKHAHVHSHGATSRHNHAHRSFLVGLVHGLAGSAALMLLVLATVDSVLEGLLYILLFGMGSVLGMTLMGAVIAVPFLLSSRLELVNRAVRIIAGSASILIGAALVYEIGFGALLTA